jgi:hypothetical protein
VLGAVLTRMVGRAAADRPLGTSTEPVVAART